MPDVQLNREFDFRHLVGALEHLLKQDAQLSHLDAHGMADSVSDGWARPASLHLTQAYLAIYFGPPTPDSVIDIPTPGAGLATTSRQRRWH